MTKVNQDDTALNTKAKNELVATESPFSSPLVINTKKQKMGLVQQVDVQQNEVAKVEHGPEMDDLVAMLECQAFALEDILEQKKKLSDSLRHTPNTSKFSSKSSTKKFAEVRNANLGKPFINVNSAIQ